MRSLGRVFLLAGCSGPVEPEDCRLIAGTYATVYVERSGNCGFIDGLDVYLESDLGPPFSGADSECDGLVDFSGDMCSVEFDRACDVRGTDGAFMGTLYFEGVSTIVEPDRIEGTVLLTDDNIGVDADCASSYDVTWTLR